MIEAWLTGLSADTKGEVFPLERAGLSMGRSTGNDLVLPDPTVSRLHARITETDAGWVIRNTNRSAGTYLNGFRIDEAVLQAGDVLEFGPHRFRFEVGAPARGRGHGARRARMFARRAGRHMASGQRSSAILAYETCAALDPGNPAFRLALARAHESSGAWRRARECFREALELDGECADAKAGIARVDERQRIYGKLGSLVLDETQQHGNRKDPGEFVMLRSEHFEIRFHINHEQTRERQIHSALERAYARVGAHLDYYPEGTRVEILASRKEAQALAAREGVPLEPWMAGFYDGKVLRILVTDEMLPDPHFPLISAVHEYTHLVCDRLARGRCPAWLSEGLALYESQNLPAIARDRLAKAVAADALIPLELLEKNFAALRYDDLINLAYAQSFSVTEFMVLRHGWHGIRAFLRALRESERTVHALGRMDWTYERLEKQWKAPLTRFEAHQP